MTTQALTVSFHDQSLVAALINDMPHVALKPICDNLGLDWTAQFRRIKRNESLNQVIAMTTMTSQGKDGKSYLVEMLMMPIKYINGWLFGVDASRVKPEIKPRLLEYQRECFDVLANHFMPQTRYGLLDLPEPPTISKAQTGVLFNRVNAIAAGAGKIRAELWSRFQRHFDLSSYKDLPAARYDEAIAYLDAKQTEYLGAGVEMLYLSNQELETKIAEGVKAKQGELLPPESSIQPGIRIIGDQVIVTSGYNKEEFLRHLGYAGLTLVNRDDYLVVKKEDVLKKLQA